MGYDYKKKSTYWDRVSKEETTPRRRVTISTSTQHADKEIKINEPKVGQSRGEPKRTSLVHIKRRNDSKARVRKTFKASPKREDRSLKENSKVVRETGKKRIERVKRRNTSVVRTSILGVIAILIIVLSVWVTSAFLHSSLFYVQTVSVAGTSFLASEDIIARAGVPSDVSLMFLKTDAIVSNVQLNSWVKEIKVSKKLPSTLVITVVEYEPVGVVSTADGDKWLVSTANTWMGQVIEKGQAVIDPTDEKAMPVIIDTKKFIPIKDTPPSEISCGELTRNVGVANAVGVWRKTIPQLKKVVKFMSAPDVVLTKLVTDQRVEIAIGSSEGAEEKSQVAYEILTEQEGKVASINVRSIESPTWRGIPEN